MKLRLFLLLGNVYILSCIFNHNYHDASKSMAIRFTNLLVNLLENKLMLGYRQNYHFKLVHPDEDLMLKVQRV